MSAMRILALTLALVIRKSRSSVRVCRRRLDDNTSGKEMTDALENGDLRWLCPDGKHVTIEYARKSKRRSLKLNDFCRRASAADLEKIVNVVRLTSATEDRRAIVMALSTDYAGVRSPAHRGADCRRPRATGRRRNSGSGPDHSPGAYLEAYHWLNRRCVSGDATPSTDRPDSSEDSEGSTSAGHRLSGRHACYDTAKSANVTRHRICLARCRDHARRTKLAFMLRARK